MKLLAFFCIVVVLARASFENTFASAGKQVLCGLYKAQQGTINAQISKFEDALHKIQDIEKVAKSLITKEAMMNEYAVEKTTVDLDKILVSLKELNASLRQDGTDSMIAMIVEGITERMKSVQSSFIEETKKNTEPFKPLIFAVGLLDDQLHLLETSVQGLKKHKKDLEKQFADRNC